MRAYKRRGLPARKLIHKYKTFTHLFILTLIEFAYYIVLSLKGMLGLTALT